MKRIASKESYLKTKTAARPTEENERIYWDKLYDISKLDPGADGSRDEIMVLALTNLVMSSDSSLDRDRVRAFAQEYAFPYFGEAFKAQER